MHCVFLLIEFLKYLPRASGIHSEPSGQGLEFGKGSLEAQLRFGRGSYLHILKTPVLVP